LERGLPGEEPVSTLRYEVVRVWQLPVEKVLKGGIGTLALAPITNIPAGDVRDVVGQMKKRLSGHRTQLEDLIVHQIKAETWEELLGPSATPRRNRRRSSR
jgi:hypothetical protein